MRDERGYAYSKSNPAPFSVEGAGAVLPTSVEKHYSETIQTHNAVSVGASGVSNSSWVDADGFDKLGVSYRNDASTSATVDVQWSHDGVNQQGAERVISNNSSIDMIIEVPVKARYFRVRLINNDTVAHTMSSWAYLKA